MAKGVPSFVCQNCGAAYNRWQGKCEACGEWNTLVEEDAGGAGPISVRAKRKGRKFNLEPLSGENLEAPRLASKVAELDRVTGGGFVRGSDIIKALAFGASAVLVARPVMWGLAAYGADGVQSVLEMLQTELARFMAMSGHVDVASLWRDLVRVHAR